MSSATGLFSALTVKKLQSLNYFAGSSLKLFGRAGLWVTAPIPKESTNVEWWWYGILHPFNI